MLINLNELMHHVNKKLAAEDKPCYMTSEFPFDEYDIIDIARFHPVIRPDPIERLSDVFVWAEDVRATIKTLTREAKLVRYGYHHKEEFLHDCDDESEIKECLW